MKRFLSLLIMVLGLTGLAGCTTRPTAVNPDLGAAPPTAANPTEAPVAVDVPVVLSETDVTVSYTLRTLIGGDPAMAYIGVGGEIDGVSNPMLETEVGDVVQITVINGDPLLHDFRIDEFDVYSGELTDAGQEATMIFRVTAPGEFDYYCGVPGHRQAGMEGKLRVTGEVVVGDQAAMADSYGPAAMPGHMSVGAAAPAAEDATMIVRHPSDVPPPVEDRPPMTVRIEMETVEVTGYLADGTTYPYFTFDGTVPGPMLRVRVGDTVEFVLKNDESSIFPHSIDLHAVTGPGGGAVATQTLPGGETMFTFQAIIPGLYVYHCATASIPHHITNGMYGLILVEPEGGLPPVDHEFYVMQGEIYTMHPYGTSGHMEFNAQALSYEQPEYFVFNGMAGGLTTDDYVLRANVGETVRIYFGVGGPNFTSSFHVIGEIFDRVYDQASLTSPPLTDVQTTLVPPGGATVVEFTVDVPGTYILVDHALSRLERGLVGLLVVEGEPNPDIFHHDSLGEESGH